MNETVQAPHPNVAILPDPRKRQRYDPPEGAPAADAQGQTWFFKPLPLVRHLDPVRDRIFDQSMVFKTVDLIDIYVCGLAMLTDNYELTPDEARLVMAGMVRDDLVTAVSEGLFGPAAPRKPFSAWARASLWTNGIDPESVPGEDLPHVLKMLQETGRAVPLADFSEAVQANQLGKMLMGMAKEQAEAKAKAPKAPTDGEGQADE